MCEALARVRINVRIAPSRDVVSAPLEEQAKLHHGASSRNRFIL
jgi:hypothetical protein